MEKNKMNDIADYLAGLQPWVKLLFMVGWFVLSGVNAWSLNGKVNAELPAKILTSFQFGIVVLFIAIASPNVPILYRYVALLILPSLGERFWKEVKGQGPQLFKNFREKIGLKKV